MGQQRVHSLLEAVINTVVGYLVAFTLQLLVFPLVGIDITVQVNIILSTIFTIASLIRSYVLRRIFNRWHIVGHTKIIQAPSQ